MYHFNIKFSGSATFDGMTQGSDFQNGRPWNFALDCMWQTYGLVGISDAYYILKKKGYTMSPADDQTYRNFILRIASAVNSGFHAWTRWADAHPSKSVSVIIDSFLPRFFILREISIRQSLVVVSHRLDGCWRCIGRPESDQLCLEWRLLD